MAKYLNQSAPFEVADVFGSGAFDHLDGELEQANFPRFVHSLNDRAIGITGALYCTPGAIDDRLQRGTHGFFRDARLAKLKPVAQHRNLPRVLAQPFHVLLRFFTETFQHHSAKILRAKNFRALSFNPAGANADLIDPVHQLGDEMKFEVGVAKGRDLSFRRENNLRILNGVLDIVLFQDCADENTTKEAQFPEDGDPEQIVDRPSRSATPSHYSSRASCACPKFGIEQETARSAPLLFLQERQERFVAVVFHSFDGNEMEGGRVDGVALSSRRGRVGKEMAEVGIAAFGADLSALHAVRSVHFLDEEIFGDWLGKRRPARAAIEFVERSKEWFAGDDVDVDAGTLVIPELILEGSLCAILPHDRILFRL